MRTHKLHYYRIPPILLKKNLKIRNHETSKWTMDTIYAAAVASFFNTIYGTGSTMSFC